MAAATPTPALRPPPGVTSNFDHPESLAHQNIIAICIAIPLATIFFSLRTYTRIWIKKTWIFEDWLALTAWVGTVAFCGTGTATMNHNGGKHEWDITPAQAQEASYWFNVASIHYGITICIAKLSVLWLYRRVFSPVRWSPFDISIVFLIVLMILFYTATSIVKIWECVPRAKIFDPSIPGSCIDTPRLLNISGFFNTATDVIILLLPVKAVWNMNMSFRKKVYVVLVFTFGLSAPAFSLAGSLVRLRGSGNPDKTWVQPEIIVWGLAELTTGILCVSFPELGPLVKKKKRRKPSEPSSSIVKGKHKHEDAVFRGKRPTQGFDFSTIMSNSTRKLDSEPYIELEEGDTFAVQCTAQGGSGSSDHKQSPDHHHQQGQGDIAVTQEVKVDSRSIV